MKTNSVCHRFRISVFGLAGNRHPKATRTLVLRIPGSSRALKKASAPVLSLCAHANLTVNPKPKLHRLSFSLSPRSHASRLRVRSRLDVSLAVPQVDFEKHQVA